MLLVVCLTMMMQQVEGQKADTLIKKLDSLQKKSDSAGKQINNISQSVYNERTRITFPVYFILLGTDFVQEVTGPFHSSKGTWEKVGMFAVAETGAFLIDKPVQREATSVMQSNHGLTGVSHYVTNFGGLYEGYTLAALGLYGWVFKNEKIKTTTLLATQAYVVGGAMESLLKLLSGRQRPFVNTPEYPGPRSTFHGPSYSLHENSSFPSGHTTVAFAAATVFAMEYRDRPLVPIISYSAATLIGLSRITENKHWASDVLAGAALGYVTGRQVVNNYHRYAYLQNHKGLRHKLSFGLQYNYDHLEPMVVMSLK